VYATSQSKILLRTTAETHRQPGKLDLSLRQHLLRD
jgi:hypothetical protein